MLGSIKPLSDTLAELYTRVTTHLITQGRRSWGLLPDEATARTGEDSTGCLYRGPDGTMCAIGCLIPDRLYMPSLERLSLADLTTASQWNPVWGILVAAGIPREPEVADLLGRLQEIHDSVPVEDWPTQLAALAEEEAFPIPEVLAAALNDPSWIKTPLPGADRPETGVETPDEEIEDPDDIDPTPWGITPPQY